MEAMETVTSYMAWGWGNNFDWQGKVQLRFLFWEEGDKFRPACKLISWPDAQLASKAPLPE